MKYTTVSFRPTQSTSTALTAAMLGATAALQGLNDDNDNPYEEYTANYLEWNRAYSDTQYAMNCEANPDFEESI